jgi:threonine dehydrogenase-like Zn-dependent dehydrogenase
MMRAARFLGEGRIAIEPAAEPEPGAGEVLLRVSACALCGSDLRPLRQGWPVTPGHEILGVVEAPGHALHGRRALVYIPAFCGRCAQCAAGDTHLCPTAELIGWQRPGGYAEALAVPGQCLIPVPDDIPDRLAPLLLDTIGTAAHGVRQAMRLVPPGPALVIGAGPIGLGALLVLRGLGFGPLAVVEPADYRAAFAAGLGAERLDAAAAAARWSPLVVEAAGKDTARQLALEAIAPRCVVVQLGESDAWSIAETRAIRRKDFFLVRSFYFPIADVAANLGLLRDAADDYARLVDATAPLEGLEALFAAFARGERLKPLLVP